MNVIIHYTNKDKTVNKKELSKKIKQTRLDAGISQKQTALRLGIPESSVSAMESGSRKIDALELLKLSELYSKNLNWFFNISNEEEKLCCYNKNTKLTEAYKLIEKAPLNIQNSIANSIIAFFK